MGIIKLLFSAGTAEGVRESIRISYRKHIALAWPEREPHETGLYGALATRYKASGITLPEPLLWAEISPFLSVSDVPNAVEALAEYIVFKERPIDAKLPGLRFILNSSCGDIANQPEHLRAMLALGFRQKCAWVALLDPETAERLALEAQALDQELRESAEWEGLPGEAPRIRAVIEHAIREQKAIQFRNHSSTGIPDELVLPKSIRRSSGQDCLIAFSKQTGLTSTYPLPLMSAVYLINDE